MLQPREEERVGGRYRLVREIARGGMGSVWAAHDAKLRRNVAVKLLVGDWAGNPVARMRFEQEAMAIAQLQTPHVVQIFDYGVEDSVPYIVMELLEGEDLRARMYRKKRLSLEEAGRVLVQTAKGLSAAHAAGIVHRDLKPGNVFLARDRDEELVKILDFGVAKADPRAQLLDPDTKAGAILGTPQFMSPEQARGIVDVDQRTDLWALGVIVFKALTGRLPFLGSTAADIIVKICTDPLTAATSLAPDLPPEIDRFFERALARRPEDRFASAREMAIAFSRIAPTSFPSFAMPEPMEEIVEAQRTASEAMLEADRKATRPVPKPVPAPTTPLPPPSSRGGTPLGLPRPLPPPPRSSSAGSVPPVSGVGLTPLPPPSGRASRPHIAAFGPPPSARAAGAPAEPPWPSALDDEAPTSFPDRLPPASVAGAIAAAAAARETDAAAPPTPSARPPQGSNPPTLQGGVQRPSQRSPSRRSAARSALVLALGAAALGAAIAVAMSLVKGREGEAATSVPPAANEARPGARSEALPEPRPAAPPEAPAEPARGPTERPGAEVPVRPEPRGQADRSAPPPPAVPRPAPSDTTASKPAPNASAPKPPPPPRPTATASDPFAERL
jgi:serine/threonine-protein kinase